MAALSLHCCVRAFSSCGEQGAARCCGIQASHYRASPVAEQGSRFVCCGGCGSQAPEHMLSCPTACEIFPVVLVAVQLLSWVRLYRLKSARLLHPWDLPGRNTRVSCHFLLDQGSNPHLLHWQASSYPLYHQGSPSSPFLILHSGIYAGLQLSVLHLIPHYILRSLRAGSDNIYFYISSI